MAEQHLGDTIDTHFLDISEAASLRDALLILTTSIVNTVTPEELEQLRSRGNIIGVDFVDYGPRVAIQDFVDVYISSSIRQDRHFRERFPGKEIHQITHHTDPEIGEVIPLSDRFRLGYFGEIRNALHREKLADRMDLVQTNNSEIPDRSWLKRLDNYNCHYSVREYTFPTRNPPPDAFKPFTKGFTAARCHSNIIVPISESDAIYYLGADYPYLLKDDSIAEVLSGIATAEETFGGEEWRYGLEIMKDVRQRSSTAYIVSEIRSLVEKLST